MRPTDRQWPGSYASLKTTRPQPVQDPERDSWDDDQQAGPPVYVLSHDEAVALSGEQAVQAPRITSFSIVFSQTAITLLCGLGWYVGSWFAGADAASAAEARLSALLGGGVCAMLSVWLAMRLSTAKGFESIARFVVGEVIKVLGTAALLVIVVAVLKGLHWLSSLITLILALRMYWVGLVLRQYVESASAYHGMADTLAYWHMART